jgi:hypothetical protein
LQKIEVPPINTAAVYAVGALISPEDLLDGFEWLRSRGRP